MNDDRTKDFAEKMNDAITLISDDLVEEAEGKFEVETDDNATDGNATAADTTDTDVTGRNAVSGADVSEIGVADTDTTGKVHKMRRRNYIIAAACFAVIVVVSVPFIGQLMNNSLKSSDSLNDNSGFFSNKFTSDELAESAELEEPVKGDGAPALNATSGRVENDITIDVKEFNGITVKMNTYSGYILDNASMDPQEVLSLMEASNLDGGAGRQTYVVHVTNADNEYYIAYDKRTLAPLTEKLSSFNDLALELGIAG